MDLSQYLSGAALVAPAAPSNPSAGYPGHGNPATGQEATKPGAYWYYQLQAEIAHLLAAAGLVPAAGDLTQLARAVPILALEGGAVTPQGNGCLVLPPLGESRIRLIVQWGSIAGYHAGGVGAAFSWPAAFPLAFPHACLAVFPVGGEVSGQGESYEAGEHIYWPGFTASTVTLHGKRVYGSSEGASDIFSVRYLAIGY